MGRSAMNRIVLPDRIRLSVTPDWSVFGDMIGYDVDSREYWNELSCRGKRIFREAKLRKFKIFREKGRPFIQTYSYSSYVGNILLSPLRPNGVQMEFNFIRYLNDKLSNLFTDNEAFEKIRIHEDNYTLYEPGLVEDFFLENKNKIPELAKNVAVQSLKDLREYVEYSRVTVKSIEFNKDFYVGRGNSLEVMNRLCDYLFSEPGRAWRRLVLSQLSSHAIETDSKVNSEQNERSLSLRFSLAKGLVIKFYNKTTDHVRCELTYFSNYIKRNFKRTSFESVFDSLYAHAKTFIEGLDVESVLMSTVVVSDMTVREKCVDVLESVQPGMSEILDAELYSGVVSSKEGIACIRNHREFLSSFYMDTDYYGNKIYVYDPVESEKRLKERQEVKRVYNHKGRFNE